MPSYSSRAISASCILARCSRGISIHQGLREGGPGIVTSDGSHWQELRNSLDLQYFGDIKVGEQTIAGVFDTGSFELLVFGEECNTCGKAVGYRHSFSRTFLIGNHTETHSFGSGTCQSRDAFDEVHVGPFDAMAFPFWEVVLAQMPVLRQANFQAIVGIGPPGEPVSTAEAAVEDFDAEAAEFIKVHGKLSTSLLDQRQELLDKVELAKTKLSLLESLGVTTFSVCLGRASGSSGWLVWNDSSSRTMSSHFQRFPVAGSITWSLQVSSVALHGLGGQKQAIGCEGGCGAIIDTGTSLFAVPTTMYKKIYDLLKSSGQDCRDLSKFPDLTLTIAGQEMRFGPDSYIGEMTGSGSDEVEKYLHRNSQLDSEDEEAEGGKPHSPMVQLRQNRTHGATRPRASCQLLLMDLGDEVTQLGPLMILGMPFFREYYTAFELDNEGKRSLAVAPADEQCRPRGAGSFFASRAEPRIVDVSAIRAPRLPRRLGKASMPIGL